MDGSVKEESSEVTEEIEALYEDVMENGLEMETFEVDDPLPYAGQGSCSSRPPRATTMPRHENTKLMTTASLMTMTMPNDDDRFTVIVPRRTPYDKHFQQRQGEQAARTVRLVEADIGTRSAIVLDGDEASAEGSEEQPEVIRDELSTAAVKAELFTTSANDFEAYVKAKSFHRQKLVLFR
ncbi:hypothetical protein AAVH_10699 [Aphelenchoides avenae]|nr:hypothetical protein AAVH_10699 [Aphelenchus avenae]